jgi:hypothetical protein
VRKKETVVDSIHGPWTMSGLGQQWTTVVRPGAHWRAHQCSASGRSGSPTLGGNSRGGGVGHGGLDPGLTEAQEAVERRRDGSEGGSGGAHDAGSFGVWREGKEG